MFTPTHGFAAATAVYLLDAGTGALRPHGPWVVAAAFACGTLPDLPVGLLIASRRFDSRMHRHHRWVTHTPAFWLTCSLLLGLLAGWPWAALLAGPTLLHLSSDWFGGGDGIPFFWPLSRRQFGVSLSGDHSVKRVWHYYTRWPWGLLELGISLAGAAALLAAAISW
jgi:hypothetical protein